MTTTTKPKIENLPISSPKTEIHSLYGGKIQLSFDPKYHLYSVNGERVLGVTSIIGVIGKPALMYWAAEMASKMWYGAIQAGNTYDEVQLKQLFEDAKKAHTQAKTLAADIGTLIHNWVEKYAKAKITNTPTPELPKNEQMLKAVQAFLQWEKENKVKFLVSERRLYSKKYNYAGTLDLMIFSNGKNEIVDIKTSSGIYPEMAYQTAAYQQAVKEEFPKYKFGPRWIVRIGKDGELETRQLDSQPKDFGAFLGALAIYSRQMALKDLLKRNGNN